MERHSFRRVSGNRTQNFQTRELGETSVLYAVLDVPEAILRSSHPEVFLEKGVLKYAANLQENTHAEM